jgi:class 3 adenylate cyclase
VPEKSPGRDPAHLAAYGGWSEDFYRDLAALEADRLTEQELLRRHGWRRAILVVDIVGTTVASLKQGDVRSALRLLAAQRAALPLLESFRPEVLRCFADNFVALFTDVRPAVAAAQALRDCESVPACRFGVGYGPVLAVGPNLAQGAEMNQVSKLGEDFAQPGEILLTRGAHRRLHRDDGPRLVRVSSASLPFPCYRLAEERRTTRRAGKPAGDTVVYLA